MRYSLAFTEDGDWLFAPDTHDRGLRILHVPGGKSFSVLRGEGPFYKAMALALGASMVALLRPGDTEGRGPYGVEVWRLTYRAKGGPLTSRSAATSRRRRAAPRTAPGSSAAC